MPSTFLRRAAAFTATTAAVCALALSSATAASAAIVPQPVSNSASGAALSVTPVGSYDTGVYNASAAEIVQPYRDRLFVVNAKAATVTVLDNSDPKKPVKLFDLSSNGVANSVAVRDDGLGVIAFEATTKTDPGHLLFFDANKTDAASAKLGEVTVGALPDMVTFSKDGSYAVVANEGEPAADFSVDPEGSVSVIALSSALSAPAQSAVKTAGFRAFEPGGTKTLDSKVRVFGPDVAAPGQDAATLSTNRVSRNLEPEYITTDGTVAYVTLQENNAVATVDLTKAEVTGILPLGYKDWSKVGLDPSDKDGKIDIRAIEGLKGLYMPDGIASYSATANGKATTYLVTANEGDGRKWGSFDDEARINAFGKKGLAPICTSSPLAGQTADDAAGRLKVVTDLGKTADGCYSELYAYGGRSFSIWDTKGALVFDSGDQFEQKLKDVAPQLFNVSNDNNTVDDRSDDKGPEPENVTIGVVDGRTYAFIGLERAGGVMVYDVTDPTKATYVTYVNNRNANTTKADKTIDFAASGDLGPEGITFVSALRSPTGVPLLVTGNEVSGTTTVFEVRPTQPKTPDLQILTINDFHGRLLQESGGVAGAGVLAGAVEKYRQQNPNTLFVSAGDNIGASAFESFIDQDTPTIKALKAATLDVSAVGNHEFDRGFTDLTTRVIPAYGNNAGAFSDFALGANVYNKGTKTPALKPYTIKQVGNTKVAFVGTVTPQTAGMVDPSKITTIEFGDETEAINREAKNARAAGADIVIVLVHDGSESTDCTTIATETTDFGAVVRGASSDVNAIVSAHTHQKYSCTIGGRSVIQTGSYGTNLGTLDIDLDATGKLASITPGVRALLDPAVTQYIAYPQAATAKIVAEAKTTADTKGKVEVGTITADITRAKNGSGGEDRGAYSTLGNTVADVYLWATSENPSFNGQDAQIAFMNPGGLRADLLYGSDNGSVSYREAANVQPFGNTLVTLSLTGAQLKQVLEQQWQPSGAARPVLALGVSKGFTFEYDPNAPTGSHIKTVQLNGKAIDDNASYRVVTNSFLAAGGDNFTAFARGTSKADSGQIDLQATVDFFTAKKSIAPSPLGRAYLTGSKPVDEGTTTPTTSPSPTTSPTGQPGGAPTSSPSSSVTVSASATRVEQGGSFSVTVSGLNAGEQLTATLNSTPIVITGIPAADASGTVTFRVSVPAALEPGAHAVVITRADGTVLPALAIQVARKGSLAATGAQGPWGIALAGGMLVVAGGLAFALRRRRTV
ncbi:choice-of-anchor I family protein [uncultured Microbacterium sp.]|uniref:choice-of-anchor I family protein n=2 Tax=uncultured Microbacterium sp. TaxID=191216 RepID=UPI003749420D